MFGQRTPKNSRGMTLAGLLPPESRLKKKSLGANNDCLSQMPGFFETIQHDSTSQTLQHSWNVWNIKDMKVCVQQSTSIRNHCRSQWRSSKARNDFLELYRRSREKLSAQKSQEFAQNQLLLPDVHWRRFLKDEILPKLAEAVTFTGQAAR